MIKFEVWGDMACFSRPEMKTERVSYDVMTPSAARGLLEAIYWHPGLTWKINSIQVCNPIRFMNIRRNEVKSKISKPSLNVIKSGISEKPLYLSASDDRQQRSAMVLKDVRYVIEASFDLDERSADMDNPGKIMDITTRRIRKGQHFHQPYLGCREFPAMFGPCNQIYECPQNLCGERDLGWMLYDFDHTDENDIKPMFFRAVMINGLIKVPDRNSSEVIS